MNKLNSKKDHGENYVGKIRSFEQNQVRVSLWNQKNKDE